MSKDYCLVCDKYWDTDEETYEEHVFDNHEKTYELFDIRRGGICEVHAERVMWRFVVVERLSEHIQYTDCCLACASKMLGIPWRELAEMRVKKWGV